MQINFKTMAEFDIKYGLKTVLNKIEAACERRPLVSYPSPLDTPGEGIPSGIAVREAQTGCSFEDEASRGRN